MSSWLSRCFTVTRMPRKLVGRLILSGTILDRWNFTAEELTQLIDENLSLRGIVLGYLAELKLESI